MNTTQKRAENNRAEPPGNFTLQRTSDICKTFTCRSSKAETNDCNCMVTNKRARRGAKGFPLSATEEAETHPHKTRSRDGPSLGSVSGSGCWGSARLSASCSGSQAWTVPPARAQDPVQPARQRHLLPQEMEHQGEKLRTVCPLRVIR